MIDLIIVVLGVFIGVGLSNWNEEYETDEYAVVFSQRRIEDNQQVYSKGPLALTSNDKALPWLPIGRLTIYRSCTNVLLMFGG